MITVAAWKLGYDGFEPEQEGLREALCTLGNGYFATRGAAEEASADTVHYPGTYLAGGYNRLGTKVAGRVIENEDLVNFPNWLPLSFRPVDGDWLNLQRDEVISYRQELDLWDGVLRRRVRVRDKAGRETTVESRRLVHMGNPHLAALQMTIRPENWSGEIEVMTALDGRIINAGVARYRQLNSTHLTPLEAKPFNADGMLLVVETNQSRLRVAEAARTRFHSGGKAIAPERETRLEEGYIAQHAVVTLGEGESVTIEKVVALHTGRDSAISEPALAAVRFVSAAGGFGDLRKSHELAWHQLWERCDITLQDSHRTQMVMRLHIFHLLQTVSLHSKELDVGVPARGLHGEAYRGHIFWDEIFILPFLNFRLPDISRSLLLYRYRRLPMARVLAKEQGLAGALYPWQSGSSGREESQVMHLNPRSGRWTHDNTYLQRHANAAIAFNIWRYYEATGDRRFMAGYGAEMFVEIARLWASLTSWDEEKGRYEINGVMGPDEFHDAYPDCETPGLNNNAYSNVMAAWVLAKAEEVLQLIPAERRCELEDLLGLSEEEVARWDDISRKLFVPFHGEGIISQFEGYEDLEELDWKAYRAKYDDIQRLDRILEAEGDTVNRYKASKQSRCVRRSPIICRAPPTARRSAGWCIPGCWRAATVPSPGGCSRMRWRATSAIRSTGRRRRAYISAPWPGLWTSSSAGRRRWRSRRACCISPPACRRSCRACSSGCSTRARRSTRRSLPTRSSSPRRRTGPAPTRLACATGFTRSRLGIALSSIRICTPAVGARSPRG
jgi:trehalose/maltose hydrolase-like predicted phosphorylase